VETAFLAALAAEARREVTALIGEFIPTKKNAPAKDFYPRHGFVRSSPEVGGGASGAAIEHWRLELAPDAVPWPAWITAVTPKRRSEA
jgi:predicted enzyme involved in methoxymalonyl-ACP biosynthesis